MAGKQEKLEGKRILMNLACVLTPAELLERAKSLAQRQNDWEAAEVRKKEVSKQLGAAVDGARARVTEMTAVASQGYEYREVECEVSFDTKAKVAITTRLDTGEEVSRRPMTDEELTPRLPLGG